MSFSQNRAKLSCSLKNVRLRFVCRNALAYRNRPPSFPRRKAKRGLHLEILCSWASLVVDEKRPISNYSHLSPPQQNSKQLIIFSRNVRVMGFSERDSFGAFFLGAGSKFLTYSDILNLLPSGLVYFGAKNKNGCAFGFLKRCLPTAAFSRSRTLKQWQPVLFLEACCFFDAISSNRCLL